ncbi:MAG: type I 3-dehydroquinate dehydratase [Bacteroidales bacterium]|nr:type I 3-dehydroquinate dehydratase [Bacteroidales bacterium]
MICVSLGHISFAEALKIAEESEMIEIRADLLNFSDEEYTSLIHSPAKIVFTCRKDSKNSIDRKSLFSKALSEGVEYLDLEIESTDELLDWLKEEMKDSQTHLILSYHNYERTPDSDELKSILKNCFDSGADIAKIACMVNSDEDTVNLIKLYRKKGRKVILGMGEKGMLTRVAAPVLGAEFTFAAANKESATAPGQLTVKEMRELFKIMKIA